MPDTNIWTPQKAKEHFSELIRRARAGEPQHITLRGKKAVMVVDPEHFEIHPKHSKKTASEATLAGFVERSKEYRGKAIKLKRIKMVFRDRSKHIFDDAFIDQEKS
jgi:prevent-host-death family protein